MRFCLPLVAAALAALAAPAVHAQDARLAGTFAFNRSASDDVVAVGMRAANVPAIFRPLARRKAQGMAARVAPPTLTLAQNADGSVTLRGTKTRTLVPGGPALTEPGTGNAPAAQVRATWDGPVLVLTQTVGANVSTDRYALDAQGRLTLDRHLVTTIERDRGQRTSVPMRFHLVYDRR